MPLSSQDPLAHAAKQAIHTGDVESLRRILAENPHLATGRIDGQRTLLHIATDWPGHFPNSPAAIQTLVAHGADIDAPFLGAHAETPLHWAASSNDIAALDALCQAGADLEAPGAVIGNGTPIADAVAFAQWEAARRLLHYGALTTLWQSAALGLMDRLEAGLATVPPPAREQISKAFWFACHGGQRAAAELLLHHGADLNWIGYDNLSPLQAALRAKAADLSSLFPQN